MYLKEKTGDLVEIADIKVLIDPCATTVAGRFHAGEELQKVQSFGKRVLVFPSGEALWVDSDYVR